MVRLDSKIELSAETFDFCTETSVTSSYDNLLDSAQVIIAKKIKYQNDQGKTIENITRGANALFKIGDTASISVGYNSLITKIFTGFISGVKTKFPLKFSLEDEVYQLKQNSFNLSLKNPQLSTLLKKIIPAGVEYEITAEQNLGNFRINGGSTAMILDELRKKHGIYSFFRDSVLYVGLAIVPKLQNTYRFEFNTVQIISGDNLEYVDKDERKIKVVCKSIDNANNTLEATAGDADGETRTLYFNNITLKDLQATADRLKDELRYSGYNGNFETFASPAVNHGDIIELINKEIPEQSGGYLCSKVVSNFGYAIGGRQYIYLKQKIYDLVEINGAFKVQNIGD
tara:strand:- start:1589 stop:2617 length:1029 start_codon:yes stop_codon:yes gene_type:complete